MASLSRIQAAVGLRPVLLSLLTAGFLLPTPADAARELCHFTSGSLEVSARDVVDEGGLGIEIDVVDGPLVLTRVAIPAEEGAEGCWQLDLDGDQRFEILVGVVQAQGALPPRLARFEWNGSLLEVLPLTDLEPEQGLGYRGGDRLELRGGLLIRSFEALDPAGNGSEKRHFRYEAETNRWIRLQALKRETAADDRSEAP